MKNNTKKNIDKDIFKSNLRLNLLKSEQKKAHENLINRDKSIYPSYTTIIVAALNFFCEYQKKDCRKLQQEDDDLKLKIKESLLEVISECKSQFVYKINDISNNSNFNQEKNLIENEKDIDFNYIFGEDEED